ncbi:hypothetical protein [Okeania sp. SIO2C2]|uniref:hypothetical protein n=1 Tax=Okeania sp. SIO2C2 TaxID=2607787 RepID=UPI00258107D0|nr:hypothetical protein [Okeania sp. SIO2C2]
MASESVAVLVAAGSDLPNQPNPLNRSDRLHAVAGGTATLKKKAVAIAITTTFCHRYFQIRFKIIKKNL